jgi:hypothetical protein
MNAENLPAELREAEAPLQEEWGIVVAVTSDDSCIRRIVDTRTSV